MVKTLPDKTVERLSQCRRVLLNKLEENVSNIYSHEIAKLLHVTPVQVRRDFMLMGYSGSPSKGYDVKKLIKYIGKTIETKDGHNVCIIGMGNLGKAIANYLHEKREKLNIVASFDNDPKKITKCISRVQCHHIDDLSKVLKDLNISIAILTVPIQSAESVRDLLVENGVKGILNFAPTPLNVPKDVYLEEIDIITSLEKVAYYVKSFK
jgi:redox-sensing transcriptional repressor